MSTARDLVLLTEIRNLLVILLSIVIAGCTPAVAFLLSRRP